MWLPTVGCVPPHLSTPAVEREITPWKPCSTTGGRRHLSYTRECSYAIIMIFMLSFRVVYFQHKLVSHRMPLIVIRVKDVCYVLISLCLCYSWFSQTERAFTCTCVFSYVCNTDVWLRKSHIKSACSENEIKIKQVNMFK